MGHQLAKNAWNPLPSLGGVWLRPSPTRSGRLNGLGRVRFVGIAEAPNRIKISSFCTSSCPTCGRDALLDDDKASISSFAVAPRNHEDHGGFVDPVNGMVVLVDRRERIDGAEVFRHLVLMKLRPPRRVAAFDDENLGIAR